MQLSVEFVQVNKQTRDVYTVWDTVEPTLGKYFVFAGKSKLSLQINLKSTLTCVTGIHAVC